jgi:hypothetical protein
MTRTHEETRRHEEHTARRQARRENLQAGGVRQAWQLAQSAEQYQRLADSWALGTPENLRYTGARSATLQVLADLHFEGNYADAVVYAHRSNEMFPNPEWSRATGHGA